MIQDLMGFLDLKKSAFKLAPYYSVFSFGILMFFSGFSWELFILLSFSLIILVICLLLISENEEVKDVLKLILKKEEDLELARKVGNQSSRKFFLRSLVAWIAFIMFIISLAFIISSFFENTNNITLIIFLIVGLFLFFYSFILLIIKLKRILKTPKIIKLAAIK